MRNILGVGVWIFLVLFAGAASADVIATFQPLDFLPSSPTFSDGFAVSGDGKFAAGYNYSGVDRQAVRWSADGTALPLGDRLGVQYRSTARAINGDGSVVVGEASRTTSGHHEAFRWENGVMTGLGVLPGPEVPGGSFATGVSGDGKIVVGNSTSLHGQSQEAFRWENGVMTPLGDLPGGIFYSIAEAISADGSTIVGDSETASGSQAFRWTSSSGMVGLGSLGAFSTFASAASEDGSVIVGYGLNGSQRTFWRWKNDVMTNLGAAPGAMADCLAYGTNADGSIIVGVGNSNGPGGSDAFIWDSAHGTRKFQDVLTDLGVDMSGWDLFVTYGVSADGFTYVGAGFDPDGHHRAWIATIPEPGILLGWCSIAMLVVRRRGRN